MRIFLGIDLPEELKGKIEKLTAGYCLRRLPIKLVERENYHLALKFLDELTAGQIEGVVRQVSALVKNQPAIAIKIENSLVFPNLHDPRVLALKVVSPELIGFGEKIIKQLNALPFVETENRRYTPHITLGRIKSNLTDLEKQMIQGIEFKAELMVDAIQLFSSQLTELGPAYSTIKEFKLNG